MSPHAEIATVEAITTIPSSMSIDVAISFSTNTTPVDTFPSLASTIPIANAPIIVTASAITPVTIVTPTMRFVTSE